MSHNIWVTHKGEHWEIQEAEDERPKAIYDSKSKAIEKAREMAREEEADLIVQTADYSIDFHASYSKAPFPPRGGDE